MKIGVIAASGRSGSVFVKEALSAGHTVRAGVYGQHTLPNHQNLEVIQCDATKPDQLENLLKGCDAAASFIGHGKKTPAHVQTDAISLAIKTCNKLGIKRIVSLTGTGVRFPGDKITLIDRFLNFGITLVDPKRIKDGKDHVEVLKQSNLDWTIVRVLKLSNGKPGSYTLKLHGPAKLLTPREEVAKACLEALSSEAYVKKAPVIGN
jgi:putative NADH-flavin reductase